MIRDFKREDIYKIEFNEFANFKALGMTIEKYADLLENYKSWTLEYDGKVQCIMSIGCLCQRTYTSGILFNKNFDVVCARKVKKFIHSYVIPEYNMERLETESLDCDVLNRWHNFLGFTSEGVKRKYLNGKNYRIWSII